VSRVPDHDDNGSYPHALIALAVFGLAACGDATQDARFEDPWSVNPAATVRRTQGL
jgi:hypothetical protein